MKKILFLIAIVLLATEALWAAHIDENRAREIARAFFAAKATRSAGVDGVVEPTTVVSEISTIETTLRTELRQAQRQLATSQHSIFTIAQTTAAS